MWVLSGILFGSGYHTEYRPGEPIIMHPIIAGMARQSTPIIMQDPILGWFTVRHLSAIITMETGTATAGITADPIIPVP